MKLKTMNLSDDTDTILSAIADQRGTNVSALIREALTIVYGTSADTEIKRKEADRLVVPMRKGMIEGMRETAAMFGGKKSYVALAREAMKELFGIDLGESAEGKRGIAPKAGKKLMVFSNAPEGSGDTLRHLALKLSVAHKTRYTIGDVIYKAFMKHHCFEAWEGISWGA